MDLGLVTLFYLLPTFDFYNTIRMDVNPYLAVTRANGVLIFRCNYIGDVPILSYEASIQNLNWSICVVYIPPIL